MDENGVVYGEAPVFSGDLSYIVFYNGRPARANSVGWYYSLEPAFKEIKFLL